MFGTEVYLKFDDFLSVVMTSDLTLEEEVEGVEGAAVDGISWILISWVS